MKKPGNVIVNSPFAAPGQHWVRQSDGTLALVEGRRPASYEIVDIRNNTRRTETLDAVEQIRQRVEAWRAEGYEGITAVTRELLTHWHDAEAREHPLALLITWQVLNALTYPKRTRDFSRAVFIVAPGLTRDRIHRTRRMQRCFDRSATPFAPTGKANAEEGLFGWIVSDFGLSDAIEAGLVKTPRVVVRDDALPDARSFRSRPYHLYRDTEVQEDLNRRGPEPHEPLPKLVQDANTAKRDALARWVQAVNDKGGFGVWCADTAFEPAAVHDILSRHAADPSASRNRATEAITT